MSALPDRRRINGPAGGTTTPIFISSSESPLKPSSHNTAHPSSKSRKLYLRTGLIASATGSSFLEINNLKLSVSVLGPRPLPRSASTPFASHAILTADVKFAPFASAVRHGYIRDAAERDLSTRLYQSLVNAIRTDLYPKSRIEVVVTILDSDDEGIDDALAGGGEVEDEDGKKVKRESGIGQGERKLGSVLCGCITAASAAIADAGIEMYDLVSGGMCSMVLTKGNSTATGEDTEMSGGGGGGGESKRQKNILLDPSPVMADGDVHIGTCVIGYMAARDEITEMWVTGTLSAVGDGSDLDRLMDGAVEAATAKRLALNEAVAERPKFIVDNVGKKSQKMAGGDDATAATAGGEDVAMSL